MVTESDIRIVGWFLIIMTAMAIVLKLTGYITWSWWLVLAPLWVPIVLAVFIIIIIIVIVHRNGKL